MQLPGGVESPSGLDRSFTFKPLDGTIELAIAEVLEQPISWPFQVTALLATALDTVGGVPATNEGIRDLAVGDRQFLLRQLGIRLRGDEHWRTESCSQCGERFDFCVRHSTLPVKEAGNGFPRVRVNRGAAASSIEFRVPNGRDQEALDAIAEDGDVRSFLTHRLVLDLPADVLAFSEIDLNKIESAIEAVAPEVAIEGSAHCPHCQTSVPFAVEPGALILGATVDPLLEQIDRIARHYHWSEGEILSLPRSRRLRYLELIDRDRGRLPVASHWGT